MLLDDILHAGDRFVLHFFVAPGICLSVLFALRLILRKVRPYTLLDWFQGLPEQIVLSALFVFAGSALREAVDVKHGQPLFKAFTDYLSWAGGSACYVWGMLRIFKESTNV